MRLSGTFQRPRRRIALAGLVAMLGIGALAPALISVPATTAQDIVALEAACRTVLRGEQTQIVLYDLSQFVPVEGMVETDVAADTPAPAGTPIANPETMATPEPEIATDPGATPDASPIAEPTPRMSTEDQLRSVVFGVFNCTNLRDFDALGDLSTNTYLSETFAGGTDLPREDLLALASITVIPELELIAFDNVSVTGNRASAEVLSLAGNQLRHESWEFARGDAASPWKVMRVSGLTPVAVDGSATVRVEIDDETMTTDPRDVSGGNVVLVGENSDDVDHEMLVLRLPSGTTTDILLQTAGPGLPPGVDFIGQMTVPAGDEAVLPLMNLPAGNYVVVDMLLDDEGVPNFASGYRARLVIGD